MYITGGIGSQGYAERFTVDDDLPPDRGYLETCAAVGVCFWAVRLLRLYREARYADILERALYNGVLAGWSLDGDAYFYTNPLHYKRTVSDYREDCRHLENGRQKWFRCACCPSNVLRLAADIQEYCLTVSPDEVDINLYLQGSWELETGGKRIVIEAETEYPFDGKVRLHIRSDEQPFRMRLGLRIPEWCRGYELSLNGEECGEERSDRGYVLLDREWNGKEEIVLTLQMPAEYVFPDPRIWDCAGKAALVRGPLVYCLESLDQEENDLTGIGYRLNAAVEQAEGEGILEGITLLKAAGCRRRGNPDGKPYTALRPAAEECEITAIPYFAWRNRGEADMDVWLPFLER
ncbi:MAG TPA: glycoside hydrolase family 127 protein, partial [Candidatus Eisenbergiella stercorigallinarum]|nr:glycoside hydrolase family 127 protein [Candidatus Eisenbergiella stercorigallinarum]